MREEKLFYIFRCFIKQLDRAEWGALWSELSENEKSSLMLSFSLPEGGALGAGLRRALVLVSKGLPFAQRRRLFALIKSVRRFSQPRFDTKGLFAYDGSVSENIVSKLGVDRVAVAPAVILTYDLDLPACIDHLGESFDLLEEYGLRATYNILTGGDYPFERDYVERIKARGHDVGLHGHSHDLDYGVKSPGELNALFTKSLDLLGGDIIGFRSPALSKGSNLYAALKRFGFQFDSSFTVQHPFYGGTGIPLPYLMHEVPLVQYPILLQDNVFFSDLGLDDEEALSVAVPLVRRCAESGGVAVLNLHLCLENDHKVFHEKLLESISKLSVPSMSMAEHYKSLNFINK